MSGREGKAGEARKVGTARLPEALALEREIESIGADRARRRFLKTLGRLAHLLEDMQPGNRTVEKQVARIESRLLADPDDSKAVLSSKSLAADVLIPMWEKAMRPFYRRIMEGDVEVVDDMEESEEAGEYLKGLNMAECADRLSPGELDILFTLSHKIAACARVVCGVRLGEQPGCAELYL